MHISLLKLIGPRAGLCSSFLSVRAKMRPIHLLPLLLASLPLSIAIEITGRITFDLTLPPAQLPSNSKVTLDHVHSAFIRQTGHFHL